jgi:hypothetical protein
MSITLVIERVTLIAPKKIIMNLYFSFKDVKNIS